MAISLTKVLHFAIGKPMAHHRKFAVKRTAKATWQTTAKSVAQNTAAKSGNLQAIKEWQIMAFLPFLV